MFQKAIALGETDVRIFERTCELLYNDGKYDEASAVLEQLGTRSNTSARAESIALQLASDQPQQLLEIAQAGVEARPSDPMAWIWYATVLVASARNTASDDQSNSLNQAQEAIDRAVFLAPNDLRVIQAEFNHYQLTRQTDRFAGPIVRLKNAESIPAAPRYIALGRMEFATGAFDDSIASYRRAIDAGGDEVAISLLLAQPLRAQRKTGLAIDTLEAAYKISRENAEVRRMLASTLAARGNATDWSRLQLILTARPYANTDSDLEMLATLYAQRGFPSDLAKAKSILDQSIAKSSTPTSQQLYRLAMIAYRAAVLQEESNEIQRGTVLRDEAEAHLARAIAQQPDDPMYRYVYTNLLIDRNRSLDAIHQSQSLLQIAPEAFESHLILARSLQAKGDTPAAIETLDAWLRERREQFENDPSNTRLLGAIGNATAGFMALGLHEQALKLLSELETISENASMDVLAALSAADDVRIRSMAVELMLRQSKEPTVDASDRARIAVAMANALLGRKMAAEQKASGEAFLLEVQSENPDQLALQQIITNYWIVQNDIPHSIDGLRAILKIKPDDPVALNNLACALAETESGTSEGLMLIDRAIAMLGELPDLLDTKGLLLMRAGKIEEAIEKFEAAAKTGEDPRILLHWYMALRKVNRLKQYKLLQPRIDVERLKRAALSDEEQEALQSLQGPASQ
jgi:tetratricopeptide (TPR) repeat protein